MTKTILIARASIGIGEASVTFLCEKMLLLVDGMATGYAGRVPASRSCFWHRVYVDDQFHGLHSKGARPAKTIG